MQTMKKKLSAIFMLLAIPYLFLTACESAEQRALDAQWEAKASANAQNYVQKKYGFAADVISAEVDYRNGAFNRQPISSVFVDMQHDGQKFTVYIDGASETDSGCDDFQAEEIKQALSDLIETSVSGLRLLDLVPRSRTEQNQDILYYAPYFDGSNLPEMLKDAAASFKAYYVQTDFSDDSQFRELERLCGKECGVLGEFFSCRSEDAIAAEKIQRDWIDDQPVYCDNFRRLSYTRDSERKAGCYYAYTLHEYGDFVYYVSDSSKFDEGSPLTEVPQITETEVPAQTFLLEHGANKAVPASAAYTVSVDIPMKVHIYFPCSKIENFDYDGYMHNQTKCFSFHGESELAGARQVTVVGDYCYIDLGVSPDSTATFLFLSNP